MLKPFTAVVKWLSIKGRINRKDYFLLHLLPVFIFIVISKLINILIPGYVLGWILIAGLIKRLKDINVKNIVTKILSGIGVGVVISVIVIAAGSIYFLQGMSGIGDANLMESALFLFAVPLLLILILPLIVAFIPGSTHKNKYGPVPRSSTLPKATLKIFVSIIIILSVGIVVYKTYLPGDPPLVREIKSESRGGSTQSIISILRDGANPNKPSILGTSPLMLAIEQKDAIVVRILLEHGANPNAYSVMESLAQKNDFTKHTPLVVAVSNFSGDSWYETYDYIIQLFLEKGADIRPIKAHEDELSPLVMAIKMNQIGKVKMFIEHGEDLNTISNQAALREAIEWITIALKENRNPNQLLKMEQILRAALK